MELVEQIKTSSLAADDERLSYRFQDEFKRALSQNSAGFNLINDEEFLLSEIDLLDNDFSLLNNDDGVRGDTEINRLTMPRQSVISSDL